MKWIAVKFFRFVVFFILYLWDLVEAALKISLDVITIKDLSHPRILEVPIEKMSDVELALIANLITFSPGTIVVDISDDRSILYIHCMFADEPAEVVASIKNRIEKRVLELMR